MGVTGFDRAKSNRVDSTVGDDRKSSKNYRRKRRSIRNGRLRPAEGASPINRTCKKATSVAFFLDKNMLLLYNKNG